MNKRLTITPATVKKALREKSERKSITMLETARRTLGLPDRVSFDDLTSEWEIYATKKKFKPTTEQTHVIEMLLRLISNDPRSAMFFRARWTGVSTTLGYFEEFCRRAF